MGDERSCGLRWELTTTVDETLARIERAGRIVELMFDARQGRFRLARGSDIVFESRDGHFQPRLVASSRSATILAGTVRPGAEGSIIEMRTRSPLLGAWPAALLLIWPLGMLVAGAWYPLVTVGGLFFVALALFASVLLVGQRAALQRQALKSLIEGLEDVRRTTSPSLGPYR